MPVPPARARTFSSTIGDDAVRFSDKIRIRPALNKDAGGPMSAYTAFFGAGAIAPLPAPYTEVWVVLSGAVRVGVEGETTTARAGDFIHVPEQAAGNVEALEDTTMVCVSTPAH